MRELIEQALAFFIDTPLKKFEVIDNSRLDESRFIVFLTLETDQKSD